MPAVSATKVGTTIVANTATCSDELLVDTALLQYSVDHLTELMPGQVVVCELDL